MLTSKPTELNMEKSKPEIKVGDKLYFNNNECENNIVKVIDVYEIDNYKVVWKSKWWGGFFEKEKISLKFVDLKFDIKPGIYILKVNYDKIIEWKKVVYKVEAKKRSFWFW